MASNEKLILLSNDDGIESPGLLLLYEKIKTFAGCMVVAPSEECSASSHAVTLREPIDFQEYHHKGERIGYRVWGQPADCVKFALCEVLDQKPDLVVSGINRGPNLGVSVYYSGTVAAAREGAIAKIPSAAFSVVSHTMDHLDDAVSIATNIIREILNAKLTPDAFLNINIPNLPASEIEGFELSRQASSYFLENFKKHPPRKNGCHSRVMGGEMLASKGHPRNDLRVIADNRISITPLQLDTTHHALLNELGFYFKDKVFV